MVKKIRESKSSNAYLVDLISKLKQHSKKTGVDLYKAIASEISRTSKNRSEVNLSKIDKFSKKAKTIIVCGKVLGNGNLTSSINIISLSITDSAKNKIENAKAKYLSIEEFLKSNIKPKETLIIK